MVKDGGTLQVDSGGSGPRLSLQPPPVDGPALRHTQSHNYGAKKKKVKVPAIPEGTKEVTVNVDVVNEQVKLDKDKRGRHSRGSRKSSQASGPGVDNPALELEDGARISRGTSAASSLRSSVRNPSVQSLVIREQYCCCSKWTPCERTLFAALGVLTCIIIILVVVVAIIATRDNGANGKSLLTVFGAT